MVQSPFTEEERCWIVVNFLVCKEKSVSVKEAFKDYFQISHERAMTLHRQQFQRVFKSFLKYKSVKENAGYANNKNQKSVVNAETIGQVRTLVASQPTISIAKAARTLNMNWSSVYTIVKKKLHLKAYKMIRAQKLTDTAKAERMLFSSWYVSQSYDFGDKTCYS